MGRSKPYADRTDLERLVSTWIKHQGLMSRREWSAAITRAATAAEIAANIAVRHELESQRSLERPFVDSLLRWANGLDGKLSRILSSIPMEKPKKDIVKRARKLAGSINKKRNEVVHSGNFMNDAEAAEIQNQTRNFIDSLVGLYHADFSVDAEANSYKTAQRHQSTSIDSVQ